MSLAIVIDIMWAPSPTVPHALRSGWGLIDRKVVSGERPRIRWRGCRKKKLEFCFWNSNEAFCKSNVRVHWGVCLKHTLKKRCRGCPLSFHRKVFYSTPLVLVRRFEWTTRATEKYVLLIQTYEASHTTYSGGGASSHAGFVVIRVFI